MSRSVARDEWDLTGRFCSVDFCHRPATMLWGDALAMTHGGMEYRCDTCALEAQLAHARAMAESIPDLEGQLAEAKAANR